MKKKVKSRYRKCHGCKVRHECKRNRIRVFVGNSICEKCSSETEICVLFCTPPEGCTSEDEWCRFSKKVRK